MHRHSDRGPDDIRMDLGHAGDSRDIHTGHGNIPVVRRSGAELAEHGNEERGEVDEGRAVITSSKSKE